MPSVRRDASPEARLARSSMNTLRCASDSVQRSRLGCCRAAHARICSLSWSRVAATSAALKAAVCCLVDPTHREALPSALPHLRAAAQAIELRRPSPRFDEAKSRGPFRCGNRRWFSRCSRKRPGQSSAASRADDACKHAPDTFVVRVVKGPPAQLSASPAPDLADIHKYPAARIGSSRDPVMILRGRCVFAAKDNQGTPVESKNAQFQRFISTHALDVRQPELANRPPGRAWLWFPRVTRFASASAMAGNPLHVAVMAAVMVSIPAAAMMLSVGHSIAWRVVSRSINRPRRPRTHLAE